MVLAAFVGVSITQSAHADMRGQVVCDVPADEAVILTQQLKNGSWRRWQPESASIMTFPTEEASIGRWKTRDLKFVCDVTILVNFRKFTGRFHRLNRKMQQSKVTPDTVYAGEYDPRRLIIGERRSSANAGVTKLGKVDERRSRDDAASALLLAAGEQARRPAPVQGDGFCGLPKDELTVITYVLVSVPGFWNAYGPSGSENFPDRSEAKVYDDVTGGMFYHGERLSKDPMPSSPYCTFTNAQETSTFKLYRLSELPHEDMTTYTAQGKVHFGFEVPFDIDYTLVQD